MMKRENRNPCGKFNTGAAIVLGGVILLTLAFGCASHSGQVKNGEVGTLTEEKLYQINSEVRFTRFYYADRVESGLLLRWQADSVLIQERGQGQPRMIPADGITTIETITGNRIMPGIGIGTLLAAGYFVAVKGYELGIVTFWEAITKLLVPPAILVTAIAVGSSMETTEVYRLPPGFKFDYETYRRYRESVE